MTTYRFLLLVCFSVVSLVLTACDSSSAPTQAPTQVYTTVTEGTLKKGDAIPVPAGDAILTVTGLIGAQNVDDTIQMDLKTIESVGLIDYAVNDPFDDDNDNQVTYRGVLMSNLLDLWQVPSTATTLHMVALNDYSVDVPIADVRTYPVIFALQEAGAYMPVSTRGPAMLVFPYDDYEFNQSVYDDYWIWQIASIEVR